MNLYYAMIIASKLEKTFSLHARKSPSHSVHKSFLSTMSVISDNLLAVQSRINHALQAAGRPQTDARLLAVSKTFPPAVVQEAYDAGIRLFGENKVQELETKTPVLPNDIEWHLIGHLQQNKVKQAIRHAAWIHSVDSEALLARINRIAAEEHAAPKVLIEVNISGEASKFGAMPEQVEAIINAHRNGPAVCQGLMTVAPAEATEAQLHGIFQSLRLLRNTLQQHLGMALPELSMGMSHDFEIALAEGATIVRVGSAIFGHRDYSQHP